MDEDARRLPTTSKVARRARLEAAEVEIGRRSETPALKATRAEDLPYPPPGVTVDHWRRVHATIRARKIRGHETTRMIHTKREVSG